MNQYKNKPSSKVDSPKKWPHGENWYECNCECHTGSGMLHFMPCCYICPKCGRRIEMGGYDFHVKECNG